jgi:hypothetical protein
MCGGGTAASLSRLFGSIVHLGKEGSAPVASPGQGLRPVDPTKAFSLRKPDSGRLRSPQAPIAREVNASRETIHRNGAFRPQRGVSPPPDRDTRNRAHPMSHSKKRQRQAILRARVTVDEKRAIAEKAKAVGGVSALFRIAALKYTPPKSKIDLEAHAQALTATQNLTTAVNRVGTNINQITKEFNMDRDLRVNSLMQEWKEFKELFDRDQLEYRLLHMRAYGFEAERKAKPKKTE